MFRGMCRQRIWVRSAARSIACALVVMSTAFSLTSARAAEFGTGPWVKGYSDILAGIIPPVPA